MYLEVYPDIIFVLNFILDFLLILLLKKVNRKSSKFLRMVGAAAIGGIIAAITGCFLWMNPFLRFLLMYVLAAALMVMIAFGRLKWLDLLRQILSLYLITYFVGGFINSLLYYTNLKLLLVQIGNGIIFSNISWKIIMIAVLILTPLILLIFKLFYWYKNHMPQLFDLELVMEKTKILTKGLLDTGNCLFDPIQKKPVMVMENSLLEKLLTQGFLQELEEVKSYLHKDDFDVTKLNMTDEHLLRLKFIPYRTVDKNGLMLGLVLDQVLIHTGKETIHHEKVIAAICDNRLSGKDSYHVILHKGLV